MDTDKPLQPSQASLAIYVNDILNLDEKHRNPTDQATIEKYKAYKKNYEAKRLFSSFTKELGPNAESFITLTLSNKLPINLNNIAKTIEDLCDEFSKIDEDLNDNPELQKVLKKHKENPANESLTTDENIFGSYFFKLISKINQSDKTLLSLTNFLQFIYSAYLSKKKDKQLVLAQIEENILDTTLKSTLNSMLSAIESALIAQEGSDTRKALPDYQTSLVKFISKFPDATDNLPVSTLLGSDAAINDVLKTYYTSTLLQVAPTRVVALKRHGLNVIRSVLINMLNTKPNILFKLIDSLAENKQLGAIAALLDNSFAHALIKAGATFDTFQKLLGSMSVEQKLSFYKEIKDTLSAYLFSSLITPNGRRESNATPQPSNEEVKAATYFAIAFKEDPHTDTIDALDNLLKQSIQKKLSSKSGSVDISNIELFYMAKRILPSINELKKQLSVFGKSRSASSKSNSLRHSFMGDNAKETEKDADKTTQKDLALADSELKSNFESFLTTCNIVKTYNDKNKSRRSSIADILPFQLRRSSIAERDKSSRIDELGNLIDVISVLIKSYNQYILEKLEQLEKEITENGQGSSKSSVPKNDQSIPDKLIKKIDDFLKYLPDAKIFKELSVFDSNLLSFEPDEIHKRLEAAKQTVNKLLEVSKPKPLQIVIPVKQATVLLPADSPINAKQSQPPVVKGWKPAKAPDSPNTPAQFLKKPGAS